MRGRADWLLVGVIALTLTTPAWSDVFRPAYLELRQKDGDTFDVTWKVPAQAGTLRLAIHVVFPEGMVSLTQPRGSFVGDGFVERWTVQRPGGFANTEVRIEGLPGSITDVLARVERDDGGTQVARLLPERPAFVVEPALHGSGVVRTYLLLGIHHILTGVDHLLFVLALVLIVPNLRRLLWTITAFTLAHSLTLAAATLGFLHVPQAPVEAAIALSIVFVAAEIVHGLQGRSGLTARAPWVIAFAFGLLHGFGFAGALAQVGLPPRAIPLALFFFNVGVEIGQILFVAAILTVLLLLKRFHRKPRAWAEGIPAYMIGSIAMFWVLARIAAFSGP